MPCKCTIFVAPIHPTNECNVFAFAVDIILTVVYIGASASTKYGSDNDLMVLFHSGKSATIRESNHGSGVCKEHYA